MTQISEMVSLAKDRAIDDISSVIGNDLSELDRFKIRNTLIALTLPNELETLDTFSLLGYWNGEEDTFEENHEIYHI